ncbi:RHS repeat-associated core domain-containing protein [Sporocytophaga myxococcoides]|uniref:RHS repeat-associated core domain-containing protein n=1 Tax=Sporocytophaga myxococcoides TaxID=153721 RepID=A0A098LA74_9BACT|nr:RHS repeat-associated core domain-containing protein [Sporocytophaga myxococcoides]
MVMAGRGSGNNLTDYRYGFNGKEMDNEMHNVAGAEYDYGARIYDARIGRFLSTDPLANVYWAVARLHRVKSVIEIVI